MENRNQLPPGPGRPKGLPNKATQEAREAIGRFVDGNSHRLQEWLDRIAEDSPEKAFNLFQSVIEYHVPKLARTDTRLVDQDGNDRDINITVNRNVFNAPDRAKP